MANQHSQPRRWQRILQRIASSRVAAWLLARTLHYLDRPLLRLTRGRLSAPSLFTGLPTLLVMTIGAKSGKPRTVPLVGIPDGDKIIVIASSYGRLRHPAWYHNLRATPEVTVFVGGRSQIYLAREAVGDERETYWERAVQLYPGFAAYQQYAGDRTIPVVVLSPKGGF